MITIRPATTEDDKAVRRLIVSVLEKEFPAAEKTYFGSDIENISKHYSGKGDRFFVACDDHQIVGTVGIKREDARNALMRRIFVRDDYRRKKIGYQLIQSAVEFCKKQHYEEMIFKTTSRMENAIRLCQAQGFVRKAAIRLGELELLKFAKRLEGKPVSANK